MTFKESVIEKVKEKFGDLILEVNDFRGELSFTINNSALLDFAGYVKNDPELLFDLCEDITAIDWAKRKNRFTLVYHVYSLANKFRIRIKVNIEADEVETVSGIWQAANWYERETFDMYGINFKNHPDLRRMYLPEEFEYFPLRKEFPLMGVPGAFELPKK